MRVLLDALDGDILTAETWQSLPLKQEDRTALPEKSCMMIRNYPVTRISVNPQTMNQETLDIIGRRHTVEETKQAFYACKGMWF